MESVCRGNSTEGSNPSLSESLAAVSQEHSRTLAADLPIVCTLSATDYRDRLSEIAALSRNALRHAEQRGLTLDLRYAPEAAAQVRQLVEQERACCAFLQFELIEDAHEVRLLVTAPPAAADAVPDLVAELTGRRQ